ncbi:phosphatidylglycerophosphate synthase [Campylobacter sp.]|uniref:phosphatidylglycerophosphate synthase n=1 Tax=Campylobacter sp. TaxID=205 RepID=UPI00270A9A87|nr:phosphatidylglycerophosphate synthase [Campylobacter sp.]
MNEIGILREIGLSEVSRKTHIETEHLGYIADKNFQKLARLNVVGLIKILKREYDIDFTQWMDEYNSFMAEHAEEVKHKTITISPKIPAYTANGTGNSSGFLWAIIFLILIGFAIWFFEAYKYIGNISNLFEDKNRSVSYSNNVAVETAKNNLNVLKDTNTSPNIEPKAVQEPLQKEEIVAIKPKQEETLNAEQPLIDQPKEATVALQESSTVIKDEEKKIQEDKVLAQESNSYDSNISDEKAKANLTRPEISTAENEYLTLDVNEFTITPKSKVWVGIINLEDGKKKTLNSEKPVTIDANKEQLVVTGHGNITLNIGEKNIKFDTVNPKRFHIQKGKITLITFDEFIELNKGKKW